MAKTALNEPIAIVGLSFRLPGGANDLDSLWDLLASGESAWQPVPKDRWNEEAFYHPNADNPNGTTNHHGGHFIEAGLRDFDHTFFRFSKSQAAATDPQQRLLLELACEALDSAGLTREHLTGRHATTSVYTACFPSDYERHLDKDQLDLPVYHAIGTGKALLANRLSHFLDLHGPSLSLDTACSGGLTALHLACQSLRSGESTTSLVAAANLILSPDQNIGLSNLHMVSKTGRCYPFDARGEGYGRGEGVVVLVLKRLSDALRDRDPVRAVVRGTAAGQDGYTPESITYPSGRAQAALIMSALAKYDVTPNDIDYVEAHGTGTVAGDMEELTGIAEAFVENSNRAGDLVVGSMKGAIGHTECVSGLASVLKAAAIFEHNEIPPVAGFANPKPGLPLDGIEIPTKIVQYTQHKNKGTTNARIAINSFGFGGANAFAILERAPPISTPVQAVISPRLFTLSANSTTSLKKLIQSHIDWVSQKEEADLPMANLSYTLVHRRNDLPYRFSAVAHDKSSLLHELHQGLSLPTPPKPVHSVDDTDVFFVFTGQGSQWAGMARELLCETTSPDPTFRSSIRMSRDTLRELGATWDLEEELLRSSASSRLSEAEIAQPVTTAIQLALLALLDAQGVRRPKAVVGHSSGEVAAAYAAGYISHETALRVAFHRGSMAAEVAKKGLGRGAMLSVGLGEYDVAKYIVDLTKGKAVVACVNSPRSVTISGDAEAIDEVASRIASGGEDIFHRKLQVDTAYHSHHMAAVAEEYRSRILGCTERHQQAPQNNDDATTFVSSVTGYRKTSGFDTEYWVSNLVSPVRFSDAIQTLFIQRHQQDNQAFFIEVGPHPSLLGPVRQTLQAQRSKDAFHYHAPLHRKFDAVASTLTLAGKLFEIGVSLQSEVVSSLAPGAATAIVLHDLPSYPWDHSTKHWHESRLSKAYHHHENPYHDLLGVSIPDGTDLEPRWRHLVSLAALPWLADHVVDGLVVFPGSGYLCMAVEAVLQLQKDGKGTGRMATESISLRDVEFSRALVVPQTKRVEMQLRLTPQPESPFCYQFSVTALSDDDRWHEHAAGIVECILAEPRKKATKRGASSSQLPDLPPNSQTTTIPQQTLYELLRNSGNHYGPSFAALTALTVSDDASNAHSVLTIRDIKASMPASHIQPHLIHPTTLDTILHSSLPLAVRHLGSGGSLMPMRIGEVLLRANVESAVLASPGEELRISTVITGSKPPTATADLTVMAGGESVLAASGMELRSFAARQDDQEMDNRGVREICYEVGWHIDVEHIRIQDLPENASLRDILGLISVKRHGLSIIGLGAGVDFSEEVLKGVQYGPDENEVPRYDFVDVSPGSFEEAALRLKGFPVQCHVLRPEMDAVARGFISASYDLVLATSAAWLHQASVLVKKTGTVLLVSSESKCGASEWRMDMVKTPVRLEEQIALQESRDTDRYVLVAKVCQSLATVNPRIRLLTHSDHTSRPSWVTALEKGLRSRNVEMSLETMTLEAVKTSDTRNESTITITLDDLPTPILSNSQLFPCAMALLAAPSRILWLCPNDPPNFHQIEGVSRTAHTENENLRLTTIHVDSTFLADGTCHDRLVDVIASVASRLASPEQPHTEREYRIRTDGAVILPRLHRSDRLNQAIAATDDVLGSKPETQKFLDSQRPLSLLLDNKNITSAIFIDDPNTCVTKPLPPDAIEIVTHSVALSNPSRHTKLFEYTGVIKKVGSQVASLSPGTTVLALSPLLCASYVRIAHTHAVALPPSLHHFAAAPSLLLDTIAATHALHTVLPPTTTHTSPVVLIQNALSPAGRAAVAVARAVPNMRVTATAADETEFRRLHDELGIAKSNVLLLRRSLDRRSASEMFGRAGLDVVIYIGDGGPLVMEAVSCVRAFGSVVVLGQLAGSAVGRNWPINVALQQIDVVGLLEARPELVAELMGKAVRALEGMSLRGLSIPVRDISETGKALKMIQTGICKKVVLQAGTQSLVQVLRPISMERWREEQATYVVAGGLGDIGLRLLSLMVELGVKHVATISRRTLGAEDRRGIEAKLDSLGNGVQLYTLQGDVSSEISMHQAAARLKQLGAPPVRGVFQAALMLMERPIEFMTYNDFNEVTKAKVEGSRTIYQVFESPHLDFVVSLSSFAGITGAGGLGAYNAGNTVQDALAHKVQNGTRFLTVNFGWTDDALLTVNDEKRQGALRRAGFTPIRGEELARFFRYVFGGVVDLRRCDLRQAIIGADAESLAETTAPNSNVRAAMFCHIRPARQRGNGPAGAADGRFEEDLRSLDQVIVDADGDREVVVNFVAHATATQLAKLVDTDAAAIDIRRRSVLELGIDSLVAVELRNWLTKQFAVPMQSSEILVEQTVWALAERVVTRVTGTSSSCSSATPADADTPAHRPRGGELNGYTVQPESSPSSNGLNGGQGRLLDTLSVLDAFGKARKATDEYIGKSRLATYSAEWMPASDQISLSIFCNALEELGCPFHSASPGTALPRVKPLPAHDRLVAHMYSQLEQHGLMQTNSDGTILRTDRPCPPENIDVPLNDILESRPEQVAEIELMRLMGTNFGRCIRGEADAVQLIFGNADARAHLSRSYSSSELNAVIIRQLTDFLCDVLLRHRKDNDVEPLCILEIGAGMGGTTSWLLPALAQLEVPVVYTFTDVGPLFVKQAASRFRKYPFVTYKLLDIEQPPDDAELRHSQHIILGTNVVHATRDTTASLRNLRGLLRPDGFVVLAEMVSQMLWTDVVFGLFEGFQCFEDGRRHATQSAEAWERSFKAAGYGEVRWTEGERPESRLQALVLGIASDRVK